MNINAKVYPRDPKFWRPFKRKELKAFPSTSPIQQKTPLPPREGQYFRNYNSTSLLNKIPDVSNALAKTKVTEAVRTKMVDWIFEVLVKLDTVEYFSDHVFHRAVLIMDIYFMLCKDKVLDDNDVHLIGVTSMWIASKYDDTYPISINDFTQVAAPGSFANDDLKEMEFKILDSLSFFISFSTIADVADFFLTKLQTKVEPNSYVRIRQGASFVLMISAYNVEFNNSNFQHLAIAGLILGVHNLFNECLRDSSLKKIRNTELISILLEEMKEDKEKINLVLKKLKKEVMSYFDDHNQTKTILEFCDFDRSNFV